MGAQRVSLWAERGLVALTRTVPAALLALIVLNAAPAEARATSTSGPHAGVRSSPCPNGDQVIYQGTEHTVVSDEADRAGGTHTVLVSSLEGEGVGLPSALEYRITEIQIHEVQRHDGTTEVTDRDLFIALAPGPDNDFIYMSLDHMTVSASGRVDRSPSRVEARCR